MKHLLLLITIAFALTSCSVIDDQAEHYLDLAKPFTSGLLSVSDSDPAELYDYLDLFIEDAAANGHDYSYVYNHRIVLLFVSDLQDKDGKIGGSSMSFGNDKEIFIYIQEPAWGRYSDAQKKILMFHELGHDIMNLDHNHGSKIMLMKKRGITNLAESITELFNL